MSIQIDALTLLPDSFRGYPRSRRDSILQWPMSPSMDTISIRRLR